MTQRAEKHREEVPRSIVQKNRAVGLSPQPGTGKDVLSWISERLRTSDCSVSQVFYHFACQCRGDLGLFPHNRLGVQRRGRAETLERNGTQGPACKEYYPQDTSALRHDLDGDSQTWCHSRLRFGFLRGGDKYVLCVEGM